MDEHREEREELAAVDREATDTLREHEAERIFWLDVSGFEVTVRQWNDD